MPLLDEQENPPVSMSVAQKQLLLLQSLQINQQYALNLPVLSSQPYSQFSSSALAQTAPTSLLYQTPDSPAQKDRISSQGVILPPQPPPPHSFLPRMPIAPVMQHPFPTNDYNMASSGFLLGTSGYQQMELVQLPMIPHYQQPNFSNGQSNTMGVSSSAISDGPQMRTNAWSTSAVPVLALPQQSVQQPFQQNYLLQNPSEQPPMSSVVTHQMQQQNSLPMAQPLYHLSPTQHKIYSTSYCPNWQKIGGVGNPGVGGAIGMDQIDDSRNQVPHSNFDVMPYTLPADASIQPSKLPPPKKNQCPVCLKVFKRPSSLQIHFHIHTGVKLYKCKWEGCGRLFNVKSNMARHYRLHLKTGIKNEKE